MRIYRQNDYIHFEDGEKNIWIPAHLCEFVDNGNDRVLISLYEYKGIEYKSFFRKEYDVSEITDMSGDVYGTTAENVIFNLSSHDRFYSGKQFRTFYELNIANGQTQVIQAIVPVDLILYQFGVQLIEGEVRVETYLGGTPGGTYDVDLPKVPKNTMSIVPTFAAQTIIRTGATATHTGGILGDLFFVKSSLASAHASSVGGGQFDIRGGGNSEEYFYHFIATGTVRGIFSGVWEEL